MNIRAVFLAFASWPLISASPAPSEECLGGLRNELIAGDFSGPLVCSSTDASFRLVGKTPDNRYSVYDFRYRYLPLHGNVMHGGQRILIFSGRRYLGNYALSPPPANPISLSGFKIVVTAQEGTEQYQIDLSKSPPRRVFVDGYVLSFFR